MLKVLIVDDEENVREALALLLQLYCPDVELVDACGDVPSAIVAVKAHHPDILLLDVEIGAGRGFDVLDHFKDPAFKVIFITAYQQYAVQAFRFAALDYLLKPVDPDLLAATIDKASKFIEKEKLSVKIDSFLHNLSATGKTPKKIVLKTADNIHVVSLCDIVYCEAARSYTNFYLADKSRIMVSKTMGEYEDLFTEYNFFRIHQSYLVNLDHLKRYEKGDGGRVILSNDLGLPVATRKKDPLLHRLSNF